MKIILKWLIIGSIPFIIKYILIYFVFNNAIPNWEEYLYRKNIQKILWFMQWIALGYVGFDIIRYLRRINGSS